MKKLLFILIAIALFSCENDEKAEKYRIEKAEIISINPIIYRYYHRSIDSVFVGTFDTEKQFYVGDTLDFYNIK